MRPLPLLLLLGCPADDYVDRSVLTGTVRVLPTEIVDAEPNGDALAAQPIGPNGEEALGPRGVRVTGDIRSWRPAEGAEFGDADHYGFVPEADGPMTFTLSFATTTTAVTDTADTAASADADVLVVRLIDLAAYDAELGTGFTDYSTDGSGGAWSMDIEVVSGASYVVLVAGDHSETAEDLAYTLTISGADPAAAGVLVGAFLGADPLVAENPVGGTTVSNWAYDPATAQWTGDWRMLWVRQVIPAEPDPDTGDTAIPLPEVKEGPTDVYVRASTIYDLNSSLSSGDLYSSASTPVTITGSDVDVGEIVLDTVVPKLIGREIAEVAPDATFAEVDFSTYTLVLDSLVSEDVGMLSEASYVDIFTGTSDLLASPIDGDAWAFTVPTTLNVAMLAEWSDPAADIDFAIYTADGVTEVFDTYCISGAIQAEYCTSVVPLEPETTYYLLALGYLGTDVQPYSIELEWSAP